jgi:hypothetical protein
MPPLAGGILFWGLIFSIQMDRSQALPPEFGRKIQSGEGVK